MLKPNVALILAKLHFASKTKQGYIESFKYFDEWSCSINMDSMQESNANFQCVVVKNPALDRIGSVHAPGLVVTMIVELCSVCLVSSK